MCAGSLECGEADCFDGVDNDVDYYTDCQDSECYSEPTCISFDFEGTHTLNLVMQDNGSDWCTGTMDVTLTTNGYQHAQLTGTGTCTLTNGGVLSLSLGGDAVEVNPTTVNLYGRVVHISANGDVSYGFLSYSSLNI